MKKYRDPANIKIAQAIKKCVEYGVRVTTNTVKENLTLTHKDLPATTAVDELTRIKIRYVMRQEGFTIADTVTRERKDYWNSTLEELREQHKIKHEGTVFDLNREKAEAMTLEFLAEKEQELGYEVYPGLFEDEIDRIFRMHHCEAPGR